jgi:hypothetical protein
MDGIPFVKDEGLAWYRVAPGWRCPRLEFYEFDQTNPNTAADRQAAKENTGVVVSLAAGIGCETKPTRAVRKAFANSVAERCKRLSGGA